MTLQSPTATLIPLFSSSELTGRGYPGLLDRKNRSDMCPRWESNPRLPACKASTLSTRPGSPRISLEMALFALYTYSSWPGTTSHPMAPHDTPRHPMASKYKLPHYQNTCIFTMKYVFWVDNNKSAVLVFTCLHIKKFHLQVNELD